MDQNKNQMTKTIVLNGREITYELEHKRVKNVNLRVRHDCSVYISANHRVTDSMIEDFLRRKTRFILSAIDRHAKIAKHADTSYRTVSIEQCRRVFEQIMADIHPAFQEYGIAMPKLVIRDMASQWGSCSPKFSRITLSKRLIVMPHEAIEYVVAHEIAHFIHSDHSARFYEVLSDVMPDWKARRKLLKPPLD